MLTTRAFELIESIDAELFGGSVTLGDGTSYDVAAALAEGNGIIVTDDERLIDALDAYVPLKRAVVPEDQRGYDGMKKPDLVAEIEKRNADDTRENVDVDLDANKETLISALRIADEKEGAR